MKLSLPTPTSFRRLLFLALLVIACLPALVRAQDTIALRSVARLDPARPVTLADIAELSGSASTLGDIIIIEKLGAETGPGAKSGEVRIDLARIRAAIDSRPNVNLGRIAFSGSSCLIKPLAPVAAPKTSPAQGTSKPAAQAGETVRDRIVARIAELLAVSPRDLRLSFEDGAELLDQTVGARTIAIQPAGKGDRLPIGIRIYEGDRIIATGNTRVGVLVRRAVIVATTAHERGGLVGADGVITDEQWLPPSITPAETAIGLVTRTRIEAGEVVQARHIEPPLAVKKGDLVSVECIAGTVIVGTTARANQSGRDGEVIEFQSIQSKRTFKARLNGPGKAVMVTGGA